MNERNYTRKAKRVDNGEWVEGFLYIRKDGAYEISHYDEEWDVERYTYEVDAATVCEPTGLTDKNSNEIWENDIVCTPYVDPIFGDMVNDKILDDYTWKVVFVAGGFCVKKEDKLITLRSFTSGNHIKVIGNVFDNPELLEVDV